MKHYLQVKSTVSKRNIVKDKERFEKRILDELNKIFTETDSFYFCHTGDITNSLQRLCNTKTQQNEKELNKPLWQRVDDRFFWNKHMLQDIINLKVRLFMNFYNECSFILYRTCSYQNISLFRQIKQTVGYCQLFRDTYK